MNLARLLDPGFRAFKPRMRRVPGAEVSTESCAGREVVRIGPGVLQNLAFEAFRDINFFFRSSHLEGWAGILDDPLASENDRFVAAALLKNAAISAEGVFPTCQDTGTATVLGLKGEDVRTAADDGDALEEGAARAYARCNLRFSQVAPVSMLDDEDTRTNLPAQIDISAVPASSPGGSEYRFLFVAKGGGSANKTTFTQETRAVLTEPALEKLLAERIRALGVAACPPYYIGVVIGGTSPEANLKMLKLATAGALDWLPDLAAGSGPAGAPGGARPLDLAYRDSRWEGRVLSLAAETGLGAQFGGRRLALGARVIRLARHAASLPVSVGVSCSAHRNAFARIGADGAWLEDFDRDPARFLGRAVAVLNGFTDAAPRISLSKHPRAIRESLGRHPVGTLVLLSGRMVVARDAAHARLARMLAEGKPLPRYFLDHPVYYAGPANTPPGALIGSFGPTTAQRMDPYVRQFMAAGASLVMVAKGNRSREVVAACRDHGGFSLGTIGGAASLIAREHIVSEELVDFPDLGFEAVRIIEVKDLPAFIVIDDKGNSLYR